MVQIVPFGNNARFIMIGFPDSFTMSIDGYIRVNINSHGMVVTAKDSRFFALHSLMSQLP